MPRFTRLAAVVFGVALLAGACSSSSDSSSSDTTGGDDDATTVGFIYVGPKDDFGYNQAAYEGSEAMAETVDGVELLQAENVPETAESSRPM